MKEASRLSRRSFMAAGMTLGAAPAILRAGVASSDQTTIGMIGVGGMGTDHLTGFLRQPAGCWKGPIAVPGLRDSRALWSENSAEHCPGGKARGPGS